MIFVTVDYYTDTIRANHQRAIDEATEGIEFAGWVDGMPHEAVSGETFETRDPAIDRTISLIPRCEAKDVDAAVDAAREAFEGEWGDTTPEDRSRTMLGWLDVLRDHTDELALLESLDTGKPLGYAEFEVKKAFDFLEYYATAVRGWEGAQLPVATDAHVYTRREPYGVVGAVLPWNYPMLLAAWKLGPALATGNAVVLKPAEDSPLTATRIAQLSADILPDGVLNVVHGFGEEVGAPLVEHAGVDKVSFTGEDVTGEQVMEAAAGNVTPVTLELGGKSPFVVFPDADLDTAVEAASGGIYYNSGQSCDACSRVLVHEDVHDEFVDRFVDAAESYELGDPLTEDTTMGPLAFGAQYQKVRRYVDVGVQEGATLLTGGQPPENSDLESGWFIQPAVFDDVENDMRIAQEEIFGPVQTINTFESYEEAIELANDVEFGLAAGIATENTSLAHRAAADIEAGSVWVNQYGRTVPGAPFGGFKRSGVGRECSKEALSQYTQSKAVNIALNDPEL